MIYHDLITEKSWRLLQDLRRRFSFILIGGWAVFLYTRALKSKDIDIICDYDELSKLKAEFPLIKNARLKKYEIIIEEVDIDIYVPHWSDLGIPIEAVRKNTMELEGFTVPTKEVLLILKQKAWRDRAHSLKGEKDTVDIVALLRYGIEFSVYWRILAQYRIRNFATELEGLCRSIVEVPELGLNPHRWSRLKRQIIFDLNQVRMKDNPEG